ncbi:hypothetical protein Daura_27220 [Dactylosporangium aurantiacum]|uniref:Uncharacterized protein n=1 Tax=Dactylosporangium aurantiacum TaxID=35754 RepID=A0A9Q9IA60_9ACTN|nr:hypothetical protein [Dactylosporangium aurantiacum]MDG6106441.1 hypothetical protein [Dactylosporangium aurantiacum]UWZ50523.1 hypothetical protein Daura_27220 [Dactylosporangium aurantiacum]
MPAPVSAAEPSRLARAWVVLAGAVVAALPVLLGAWSGATLSAVGQFAMWWSIPWGLGIAGAGALHTGQPGHRDRRPAGSAGKPVVTAEPSPGAALVTVTPGH